MTRIFRNIHHYVRSSGSEAITAHVVLWQDWFWAAWESLQIIERFAWILFLSNVIGIITLLEMLVLKKIPGH